MGPTGDKAAAKAGSDSVLTSSITLRKSLKTLQRVATDKENLTGRTILPQGKDEKKSIVKPKLEIKKKVTNSKAIQAGADLKIKIEDLTSEDGPSENYWQAIAERRRKALEETLDENRILIEKIEELEKENAELRLMVDESKSLVDVLTEMVGEAEESGIDLAEASTTSALDESKEDNETESKNQPSCTSDKE